MKEVYYVGRHLDESINKDSSSGGAFSSITDAWLKHKNNPVIYGCILNEELEAIHFRAVNAQERNLMRGSKYISSNISGIFKRVEIDLKNGVDVFFSGTPCQISGLKAFLAAKSIFSDKQLVTAEVICHGVGSNRFFADYIAHLEKKFRSKAISCKFRAKSKPGKKQDMEIRFQNGKKYNAGSTYYDWFYSVYLKNLILRPSCYKCKFACEKRNADITIADYWEKDSVAGRDESLIIVNTDKGNEICKIAFENMTVRTVDGTNLTNQPHLHAPCRKPEQYDSFWKVYNEKGYLGVQKKIGNNTLKGRIKVFLVGIINMLNLSDKVKKYFKNK